MVDWGNRLMNAFVRIQNVILDSAAEWTTISQESSSIKELYIWHIIPLAAIGPAASFAASSFDGISKVPIAAGLCTAFISYVVMLASVYLLALVVSGLAGLLGDDCNQILALKLTAYAYTPTWLAGMLYAVPFLELVAVFGSIYAVYLLHQGISLVMKVPTWKATCYALAVTISALLLAYASVVISGSTLKLFRGLQAGKQQEKPAAAPPTKPQAPRVSNPSNAARRDVPRATPYQAPPPPMTPAEASQPPVEAPPPLITR